jgi:EAL domain-containing protein (putative c-di-GMP-specific phosphodiesterase class I)
VNLSPVQFKGRNLVGTVMSALAAAGLDPGRLELEVTETVILHNNEATTAILHKLRGLGIRIAMDDFSTGYSSLSYLRSFPFDNIKIDRSFVRDLSAKPDSLVIVHAVTDLARNLGMTTTAEGVETEQHREMLRNEGCTEIQGYLISPPKPADAIPGLLARYRNGDCAVSPLRHHVAAA